MILTKKQFEILNYMEQGWNLGYDTYSKNSWLQRNELGRGGETIDITNKSKLSLERKKLITSYEFNYPVNKYILTSFGKEILHLNKIKLNSNENKINK